MYLKADKGNKVVILDEVDYQNRTMKIIEESGYKLLDKDPLSSMVAEAKEIKKEIVKECGLRLNWSLNVSNPEVPKLFCLPKIHKSREKMRPIISNVNAPTEKISKWLVSEFNKLKPLDSCSIKNSTELVEKLKDVEIADDEAMVSFDVTALFPSIPLKEAMEELKKELIENDVPEEKRKVYMKASKVCMNQNIFQFRNKFYKIEDGTSMGNSFSPKVAESFMSGFERRLKEASFLPRIWVRYVDDVFAIVKNEKIDEVLEVLNQQFPTIKFTFEVEEENSLNFVDLKLTIRFMEEFVLPYIIRTQVLLDT